jgi:hypothetical protein
MTCPWLIAKQTEHAARDHGGLRLVDASAGHASMGPFNAFPFKAKGFRPQTRRRAVERASGSKRARAESLRVKR